MKLRIGKMKDIDDQRVTYRCAIKGTWWVRSPVSWPMTLRHEVIPIFTGIPVHREDMRDVTYAIRASSGINVPIAWDAVVARGMQDGLEATLLACSEG